MTLALLWLLACSGSPPDHGHGHSHGGGHAHGEDDSAIAITRWTDAHELFAELDAPIAGQRFGYNAHVTRLADNHALLALIAVFAAVALSGHFTKLQSYSAKRPNPKLQRQTGSTKLQRQTGSPQSYSAKRAVHKATALSEHSTARQSYNAQRAVHKATALNGQYKATALNGQYKATKLQSYRATELQSYSTQLCPLISSAAALARSGP